MRKGKRERESGMESGREIERPGRTGRERESGRESGRKIERPGRTGRERESGMESGREMGDKGGQEGRERAGWRVERERERGRVIPGQDSACVLTAYPEALAAASGCILSQPKVRSRKSRRHADRERQRKEREIQRAG